MAMTAAATNYPLVRIRNRASGKCDTAGLRITRSSTPGVTVPSMGVATGNATITTQVNVPSDLALGGSELVIVANGIPSRSRSDQRHPRVNSKHTAEFAPPNPGFALWGGLVYMWWDFRGIDGLAEASVATRSSVRQVCGVDLQGVAARVIPSPGDEGSAPAPRLWLV